MGGDGSQVFSSFRTVDLPAPKGSQQGGSARHLRSLRDQVEQFHAIVLTGAYQQAGAIELLRPANGMRLPPVYSGHNGFWYWDRHQTRRPTPL